MFEQTRSVLNDEYRGVPNSLTDGAEKYNRLWGPDYIIYLRDKLNEDDVEAIIEAILLYRALS